MTIELSNDEAQVVLGSIFFLGDVLKKGANNKAEGMKSGDHADTINACDNLARKFIALLKEDKKGGIK